MNHYGTLHLNYGSVYKYFSTLIIYSCLKCDCYGIGTSSMKPKHKAEKQNHLKCFYFLQRLVAESDSMKEMIDELKCTQSQPGQFNSYALMSVKYALFSL